MALTKVELQFLASQHIAEDEVFDATRLPRDKAHAIMKVGGIDFMIGGPCRIAGHRLRTRAGHCIQCDTRKIAFQRRYGAPGVVYVAHSQTGGLTKVGSGVDITRRLYVINYQGYGAQTDWKDVFQLKHAEAGRIEQTTHQKLRRYQVERTYQKEGVTQTATEVFMCSPDLAISEIKKLAL